MKQKRTTTKIPKTKFDDALGGQLRLHFGSEGVNANLRSSHGPLVEMALAGPPTGGARQSSDASVTDRRLYFQGKQRRTHEVLQSLSMAHQNALWLAYGPERWSLQVYSRFPSLGACAGVVLVSVVARDEFAAAWEARVAKGHDERTLDTFVRRGLGEWLKGARDDIVTRVAIDAGALLGAARKAFAEASAARAEGRALAKARRLAKAREEALVLGRRTAL